MNERADQLITLYSKFGQEARKFNRMFLPCKVLTLSNMVATAAGMSWWVFGNSPEYLHYYFQHALVPEISAMTATALVPLIGKRKQEAILKETSLKIAEIEGREVSTDHKQEWQRIGFISYCLTHLLHELPSKMPHLNDNRARVRQRLQALVDKHISMDFMFFDGSTKINGDLRRTSLELGEYYWGEVARDRQQPDYRRMYAYKKLAAIRQRLQF